LYEEQEKLLGCVAVQKDARGLYVGMFAVEPLQQNEGIGKTLLKACETYAQQRGVHVLYMTVITQRTELLQWYMRRGYQDTGERKPFLEDTLTGVHKEPLVFAVLEKRL
jgi:ribosomal protein S18 acetylase RimI-like enzyme